MRTFGRLPARPPRDRFAGSEAEDYDRVAARTDRLRYADYDTPVRYFEALLNAPPLAAALVQLGTLVREGQLRGSYTDAERELVDIVLGVDLGYNGIFTVHIPDALAVGVRPEAIDAIRARDESALTPEEAQIAAYSRAVVSGAVTDELYAAMAVRLGDRGVVEFTVFIGFLNMTIRMWQAFGVPDPADAEIDELLRGLYAGSVSIPGPAARIG